MGDTGEMKTEISKEQLERTIELYSACMDDYLYVFDLKEDSYRISPRAAERFCMPGDCFTDASVKLEKVVAPDDWDILAADLTEVRTGAKKTHDLSYRWLSRQGEWVWINCRGRVLDDADGTPHFLIGCINEIGERQKADNVSGLLGASSLSAYVQEWQERSPRGFFMRVGIDNLGAINGNLGMDYGDFIIKKTAECQRANLLEGQKLFRIVADEFMIVDFSGRTGEDALALYKRIRKSVDAFIEENNYLAVFTISAGILGTECFRGGYDTILKLSEFALNEAKARGRNSYYIFEQEQYDKFKRRRMINRRLHHAVNHDFAGFDAYFQPIVDAKTHRLIGAEALMRFSMEKEDGGTETVSPAEFIPLLEQTGLIIPAGRWMLQQAISVGRKWQEKIPDFRMNINLSYIQVMKSNVLKEIMGTIEASGILTSNVGIELTESGYLDSSPHFRKLWNGLKENGVLVILDDFGTGYSNLHCLGDLEPNYIKIDRSFTLKALQNEYEHELLRQIIGMSHRLGLSICIEGIETEDELSRVKELGADYIQGYLFGKPYPKDEFERRMFG